MHKANPYKSLIFGGIGLILMSLLFGVIFALTSPPTEYALMLLLAGINAFCCGILAVATVLIKPSLTRKADKISV